MANYTVKPAIFLIIKTVKTLAENWVNMQKNIEYINGYLCIKKKSARYKVQNNTAADFDLVNINYKFIYLNKTT